MLTLQLTHSHNKNPQHRDPEFTPTISRTLKLYVAKYYGLCRLQKLNNNAVRVAGGSKEYDHITPILEYLHWLSIRKRIEFKILIMTFKCRQGCAPLYLRELLVKQASTRTRRSITRNYILHNNKQRRFGTEPSVPNRHAFGLSSSTTSRLLIVGKTSRHS